MLVVIVALLIVVLLGVAGFAVPLLWWVAIAALSVWLLGFLFRVGEITARPRRRRWYYW
jgi:membrane protein YdbS with pleckstrin-like domain